MAGGRAETLPDELRQWVEQKADELDSTPSDVLVRAVSAYRLLEHHDDELTAAALDGEFEDIDARLERTETEFTEKIEDVRSRIVQVKRETDQKAPADHDHAGLRERTESALDAAERAQSEVETLRERLDGGFENYEEILEYLTETSDELDERLHTVARSLIDLRQRMAAFETADAERAAVAELKDEANRQGTRRAACEACGSDVDLSLLSSPRCPHCEASVTDVEPARGFFSSPTLVTGAWPALTGDSEPTVDDPEEFFEQEANQSTRD